MLQTHSCIIGGCATGEAVCRNEWTCCDYGVLSLCVSPADLTEGACPNGGSAVAP